MKNRVLMGLIVAFVVILVLGIGPWWNQLQGGISPPPPNVSVVYFGDSQPPGEWQFKVEDRILTDCMVAYLYSYDGTGKLVIYEIDSGTLKELGVETEPRNCTNVLRSGILAVNFTEVPETLSIEIWVSKSSTEGKDIYFQELGNWRFVNGSYIGFIAPPMNEDYRLVSVDEVRDLMNQTGIHYISRH